MVDPWGNQPGEVIPEEYSLPGREIFRLPSAPIPTLITVATSGASEQDADEQDTDAASGAKLRPEQDNTAPFDGCARDEPSILVVLATMDDEN